MTTEDNTTGTDPVRKNGVSVDDLYRRSTQYNMWSFTETELAEIHRQTNLKGQAHAAAKFDQVYARIKLEQPEIMAHPELQKQSLVDPITLDEEIKYLTFYSKNIIQAANFFKMPTQVKATAICFFKRFYLYNSVMQYHPKNVLYTCLFLAAKSENYFISIESFCKALQKTEPSDVLDLEFTVLHSLKFTLLIHHPFRSLYGFFFDFQQVLLHNGSDKPVSDVTVDQIGKLYDDAKKWLNDHGLLSDVAFLFTPPQIALAAMYDCNPKITEAYLKEKFSSKQLETIKEEEESESSTKGYDTMLKTIVRCATLGTKLEESSREESTKIDRKCFFAINPDKLINKKIKKLKQ